MEDLAGSPHLEAVFRGSVSVVSACSAASGFAYYRTKRCTLTVSVNEAQGSPDRRSEAVALAKLLLGSSL